MPLVFGIDLGIASVGWAVLDTYAQRILAAGTWMFDAPENPKDRTPTNAIRRQHRAARRVMRRRRQRMAAIRGLLVQHGLLEQADRDALRCRPGMNPWTLRSDGLDRVLTGVELALALGHVARHRGFRSNSKRDRGANAAPDTSKMLSAIDANRDRLAQWRTVGEMLARDPEFKDRKRNHGDYTRTLLRSDLEKEVQALFSAQRRLGNALATKELEAAFLPAAFDQRPLQDSEHLVRPCPFELAERRAAKYAPSFERFRLLSRLTNLRLLSGREERPLTPDQLAIAMDGFGKQKGLSFKALRTRLDLAPSVRFADVMQKDEGRDVATRTGGAAEGTAALRDALGEGAWRALLPCPGRLDRAAEVLTFREDLDGIRKGLHDAGLDAACVEALMTALEQGRFARFKGAAHISAKAARAVNRHLGTGLSVSDAFKEAGYDHAARPVTDLKDVANPVARKALGQALKQVGALIQAHGLPDAIRVELARDVGKSAEERDEITRGIEDRNAARDRLRMEFKEKLHRDATGEDLLRFELWKEQGGFCLYTGSHIPLSCVVASDNSAQVDHILPWSRFGDDSFANKTLCTAKANQDKKGRTPFEWFETDKPNEWATYVARVEGCKEMKTRKKRGFYLRRNAAEVETAFRARNLGDTRYASRLLLDALTRLYPEDGRRHVLARPGVLTARLRQAWGLEGRKKGPDGKRLADDRHHALDAMVVAACSEAVLQQLTVAFQKTEARGSAQHFKGMSEPWPGFREQAHAALERVFVARPERRRVRGEAHEATVRQVRERDGKLIVYERRAIEKLTEADLDRVKDKERNAGLVEALRAWIRAGRPKDALPRSPSREGAEKENPPIRKVRLETKNKVAVTVRGGTADRGEMVRVDVFRENSKTGKTKFHLVPIYPHQVADQERYPVPPTKAVVAAKPEAEWTCVAEFDFLFSLHHNSLVEVTRADGKVVRGYFKGVNRSVAAIAIAQHISATTVQDGIGSKTLHSFRKLAVDRAGNISEVSRETRTWHGAACT